TRAVTSDTRRATKRKMASGAKMPRKRVVKRRDSHAVALQDARFRKRVVNSGKLYNRKAKPTPEDVVE
ncbi:MAG: hypothetical protein WB713_17635, partial [Methyloceanibacter sp.]